MDMAAMQTEALPITLVPLEEDMQLVQGDQQAQPDIPPAPKPATKPQEKEQAIHVGDGSLDRNAPLNPRERPREVEVASAQSAPPQERQDPVTSQEQMTAEEAKMPNLTPPQLPAQAPQQSQTAAEVLQPQAPSAPPTLPALPDMAPAPAQKPKIDTQTAARQNVTSPRPVEPVRTSSPPATQNDSLEEILAQNAALIDRTRTQGGGARRSEEAAGFGSRNSNNNDQHLAQTIGNIIGGCVQRNWRLASISGSSAYDLAVQIKVQFRPDGSIDGEPELTPSGGDAAQRDIMTYQALGALRKCAPFDLPADAYSKWRDVTINMKAFPG